ncbi:hypothetical protein D7X25_20740 [bacterium 1XD42-8]|nr:hypothetical protein D7X25_20740 [bacterium 1XD42-8]
MIPVGYKSIDRRSGEDSIQKGCFGTISFSLSKDNKEIKNYLDYPRFISRMWTVWEENKLHNQSLQKILCWKS